MASIIGATNPALHRAKVYLGKTLSKGLGIFANKELFADEIIEFCPILFLPEKDARAVNDTMLDDYCFGWMEGKAIALGHGSLYNHSYTPNAMYVRRYEEKLLEIRAIKVILQNEEITINYNGDPECQAPVWFDVK